MHTTAITADTAICLARSPDGLLFHETGQIVMPMASSPSLVALPDGSLLLTFDADTPSVDPPSARKPRARAVHLFAARSRDDGRSWSRPRPVRITGADGKPVDARRGFLLPLPDGRLRLYFITAADTDPRASQPRRTAWRVRAAITTNGWEYRLDDAVSLAIPGMQDPCLSATTVDRQTHLYVADLSRAASPADAARSVLQCFESPDGRRFMPRKAPAVPGIVAFIGDFQSIGRFTRAYVTTPAGIASLISSDGRDWRPEAGRRIGFGSHPAVAQLRDRSFVMCYTIDLHDRGSRPRLVSRDRARSATSSDAAPTATSSEQPVESISSVAASAAPGASNATGSTEATAPPADADSTMAVPSDGEFAESDWPAFAAAAPDSAAMTPQDSQQLESSRSASAAGDPRRSDSGQVMDGAAPDSAARDGGGDSGTPPAAGAGGAYGNPDPPPMEYDPSDPFPPQPNFSTPFDYLAWYKARYEATVSDNAYEYYREFMPGVGESTSTKPGWPTFNSMLHDAGFSGPPQPWDPAAHPDWEATRQAAATLIAQFQEATRHAGFARLVEFGPDELAKTPPGEHPPMIAMLLPDLSGHRALVKQVMSDAWRTENGKVSPDNMLEAWRTSLDSANHMHQGTTLIEHLVGTAEQNLVEQHARWALKQNVFSPEQLDTALGVLMQHDRDDADPALWMTGEYAWAMDTVQYVFKPTKPGDPPAVNPERLKILLDESLPPDRAEKLKNMKPDDARKTAEAMDKYYREIAEQFRVGYPNARAADLEATTEKYVHATPVTEVLLPSLSRAYQLRARSEASRRATQLTFAVHSFKAATGRWPSSLDELPVEYGAKMRTDPFTGGYFGYRVGKDGPIIYSLSENGRDDGGLHSNRWNDEKNGESDDYVFWPPQPPPARK